MSSRKRRYLLSHAGSKENAEGGGCLQEGLVNREKKQEEGASAQQDRVFGEFRERVRRERGGEGVAGGQGGHDITGAVQAGQGSPSFMQLFAEILNKANKEPDFLIMLRNLLSGCSRILRDKKNFLRKKWEQLRNSNCTQDEYLSRESEVVSGRCSSNAWRSRRSTRSRRTSCPSSPTPTSRALRPRRASSNSTSTALTPSKTA